MSKKPTKPSESLGTETHRKERFRVVVSASALTEHRHYRSIERLAGLVFGGDILGHNNEAVLRGNKCSKCGYEMNYYDIMAYSIMAGVHSVDKIKEILAAKPTILGTVKLKIKCLECGGPLAVEGQYLCAWRVVDPRIEELVRAS
ncbi:MAG: hypothetical protein AABN95_19095 [Acidobacteriota bacterium]